MTPTQGPRHSIILVTAALLNSSNPIFERFDVLLKLARLGEWNIFCRRLIVTRKPLRALRHPDIEYFDVSRADVGELVCALRLNTVPVPFNGPAQEHFLQSPLPRFAEKTIYDRCDP